MFFTKLLIAIVVIGFEAYIAHLTYAAFVAWQATGYWLMLAAAIFLAIVFLAVLEIALKKK